MESYERQSSNVIRSDISVQDWYIHLHGLLNTDVHTYHVFREDLLECNENHSKNCKTVK